MAGTRMTPLPVNSLSAPAAWQRLDVIADLHLQASEPQTFEAWAHYMRHAQADAVFILGDLFEVWVGDDAVSSDPFLQSCLQVLHAASQQCTVLFMPGNRDFLVGQDLLNRYGVQHLADPCCLTWGHRRWLLSHGDALCLEDTDYQAFRKSCRSTAWQTDFLGRPLSERQALAQQMRQASRAHQARQIRYADPDTALSLEWLDSCKASTLIHGHTHRPADHLLDPHHQRIVLSDWCLDHTPHRSQVLRLHADGELERLTPVQACAEVGQVSRTRNPPKAGLRST